MYEQICEMQSLQGPAAGGQGRISRDGARQWHWLRAGRGGMFLLALMVGVGAGLGAVRSGT